MSIIPPYDILLWLDVLGNDDKYTAFIYVAFL